MAAAAGLLGGLGLFLIWWSCWQLPAHAVRPPRVDRIHELLLRAGVEKVSSGGLIFSCACLGVLTVLVIDLLTRSLPIALCFGLFGGWLPLAVVQRRARQRTALLRQLWPDVVDHLRSAIRAGLSLPEALSQLGEKGPLELRTFFTDFGLDYRASGQFDSALAALKERLADPVADRIVEALRLTREVGGSDLGRLLGTLAEFLRDNARTRSELEARQSWTVNAARLAVAAPWLVLMLLATRPEAISAYNSAAGWAVLLGGLLVSLACYRVMLRIGALPADERVIR
ncbi:type II secretion system F family protein [Paenarthrobacter sp. Z7-10]|uniref:type II secretion system F family protein n=1 Tax=Paenarthrobacter sp. Z7-10 TaxID=2787635 RepID=UPI0022A90041|nr:type II secretion system F family protein [Paenarthrobacter sp. Z7-10]MCZ2403918.1 type II secretion system F family protein [Paenarthrobacter sp. Z7-10]